jgi:hypothetical protein
MRQHRCSQHDVLAPSFDLLATFSSANNNEQHDQAIELVYQSFTLALMTKRKFDLHGTIIIYQTDQMRSLYAT